MLRSSDKIAHCKNLHVRGKKNCLTWRQDTVSRRQPLHGFTLIELLVVIAIIALLVSILLPSLNKAKELAQRIVCASNQRGIGQAIQFYLHDSEGIFPMPQDFYPSSISYIYRGMTYYGSYLGDAKILICPADDINGENSYAISQWTFQGGASNPLDIESVSSPEYAVLLWAYWYPDTTDVVGLNADYWPYAGSLIAGYSVGTGDPNCDPLVRAHLGGSNILFMDFHVEYFEWDPAPGMGPNQYTWPIHSITTYPYE